jgi:hypothetical protein
MASVKLTKMASVKLIKKMVSVKIKKKMASVKLITIFK